MIQTPDQWLVEKIGLEQFKGGFERIFQLLRPTAELIQKKTTVVTIAGTNGKGQTSFDLYELLKNSGKKVAVWTSPHILNISERFGFSEDPIDDQYLLKKFQQSEDLLDKDLSYYEFLFVIFCRELLHRDLDVVILEVGLGGRLDAVNIFDADLAAIVSISLDHQAILGETTRQILQEKWGIARKSQKIFSSLEDAELRMAAKELNAETQADWLDLFDLNLMHCDDSYSIRNRLLALTLWSWLERKQMFSASELAIELKQQTFSLSKGRQEVMTIRGRRFIFIGAHNVDGLTKMMLELEQKKDFFDQVWFSFSTRPLSEIRDCLAVLLKHRERAGEWSFFEFDHPKAFRPQSLEQMDRTLWEKWILDLTKKRVHSISITDHLSGGGVDEKKAQPQSILVTGSYYFISNVQKALL